MDLQDAQFFLGEGKFTKRDEVVKTKAQELIRKKGSYRQNISEFLSNEFKYTSNIKKRTRTASEIIASRKVTGCSDVGIVFLTLAREGGIPARYVETLQKDWIDSNTPVEPIQGHVFADIFVDGNWAVYEPQRGFTSKNKYILDNKIYVPIGRGLDFGELDTSFEGFLKRENFLQFRKS